MNRHLRVGFIGLGDQGAPMARAIADDGWPLRVWARRPASLDAMAGAAFVACDTIAELAATSDIVGLCLRSDADAREVLTGLLPSLAPGAIVANHGTGSPDLCPDLEALGRAHGVAVLDAPVSGGSQRARARSLTTMVAGDKPAAMSARPVFESFSGLVTYLGPAGSAQLAKLLNNVLFAANLKNARDALAVGDRLGMDAAALAEILQASSGASFGLEALTRHIQPGLVDHYRDILGKDLGHFQDAARARGVSAAGVEQAARDGVAGIGEAIRLLAPGPGAPR
jgi:3-hydroxyisobutyrate dehydrogenase-like beta-hydroxyacid dehydrogenase